MPDIPADRLQVGLRVPGLTEPALVVLVGPSGAGKSTWAAAHYRAAEVVSSDQLRAVVGSGPNDLDASVDAFAVLDQIVAARVRRKLTVVVDTLGLDTGRRAGYRDLARKNGLRVAVVILDTPAALCRARNAARDRPVPAPALAGQIKRLRAVIQEVQSEGWDEVLTISSAAQPAAPSEVPVGSPGAEPDRGLEFVLQISRFPWGEDPAGWLTAMATTAALAGFSGIALMDHLIQIPQVGRAWDPIPEPWVTLGLVAGLDLGLRLGTLVSPVTFRPPGIIAKAAATLDVLSGGRAFVGLGAGWWEREHLGFGLPFPPAAERFDQLQNSIETIRALWAPGTKAYSGQRVRLPETTSYPRPAGPIPIIVGGGGERRTLRIAAALADGCNLTSDPEVLAHKIGVLHEHCRRAGRDPAEVLITVLDVPIIGSDREQVASRVEQLRGRNSAATLQKRSGTAEAHVARYRELAALGVRTVFVAPAVLTGPDNVAEFAPVLSQF